MQIREKRKGNRNNYYYKRKNLLNYLSKRIGKCLH